MNLPLVSIVCVVKNRVDSIKRCINSILLQNYDHVQIVVQDGGSTDGTLEILMQYGSQIDLVSCPDKSPSEGWNRALKRVKGDLFIHCFSDEELLPGAIKWGVEQFSHRPDCAAIYGETLITNLQGEVTLLNRRSEWNLETYLCGKVYPPLAATFFSKKHYDSLHIEEIATEFDIFIRLGVRYPILYISYPVAKYALHDGALSRNISAIEDAKLGEIASINAVMNDPYVSDSIKTLRKTALAASHFSAVLSIFECYPIHKEKAVWRALPFFKQGLEYITKENKLGMLSNVCLTMGKTSQQLIRDRKLPLALVCLDLINEVGIPIVGINYMRSFIFGQMKNEKEKKKALQLEELTLQTPHAYVLHDSA
ncbi:MAG: hypothetical protein K0S74_906 [Chlamydiales bacterium]|jgi:hypothetical protein|nr:hypothetical protein [Chlamydiales bacterium]